MHLVKNNHKILNISFFLVLWKHDIKTKGAVIYVNINEKNKDWQLHRFL